MEQLTKEQTIALREKYIASPCQLFFSRDPLKIVRAEGQYMYDERGARYLDCINNVAHVGHCHPDVVKAGCKQMGEVSTNNRFLHDNIGIYAQKLVNTFPQPLSVCFFVNSGSEANDLAMRLAQIHTGNKDVIAVEHAYHGHLTSTIDFSHYKLNLPGGPPQKDYVHIAPCPDSYRGKFRQPTYSKEQLGKLYAQEVKGICDKLQSVNNGVCAFISESLLSCGGQVILPPNYLRDVYKYVRAAGGVCVADEVQVGFGRVGTHFWAFQMQGDDVVPDIVTVGKPMGNGHPVAAVITTRAIADSFKRTGVGYFNTYGGNPVSCAIANAVLDVISKENLQQNALVVGEYLKTSCELLAKKHSIIGDVRGCGLFVGIELVTDQVQRTPATDIASYILGRMKEERILISADGPNSNVLKFKPPMVFTKENVDELMSTLDIVISEVQGLDAKATIIGKESLIVTQAKTEHKIKAI